MAEIGKISQLNINGTKYDIAAKNDVVKVDLGNNQITDELFDSWIDAYERGALFYSINSEPLSVDKGDYYFRFWTSDNFGIWGLNVSRSKDEKGDYVYNVDDNSYDEYYTIAYNSLASESFSDDEWHTIKKALDNGSLLYLDNDRLYYATVWQENDNNLIISCMHDGDYEIWNITRSGDERAGYTYNMVHEYNILATIGDLDAKANSADLATVATTGSYNDLADKPVIPEGAVVDAALSDTSVNPVQNKVVKGAIDEAKTYYIDFGVITTQGIHDADWDGMVNAINAHRPIYAGFPGANGLLYYTAECLYQDGSNTIRMTASDNFAHYFYTFVKNGSENYGFDYVTRPYTTQAEKDAWNAKQDTISDLATIRSGAALGATAYQKPSTGIPASDIADGVIPSLSNYYDSQYIDSITMEMSNDIQSKASAEDLTDLSDHVNTDFYSKTEIDGMIPTVPTNVSEFNNDAGYLTQHQDISGKADASSVYTKTEIDNKIGDIATVLASI